MSTSQQNRQSPPALAPFVPFLFRLLIPCNSIFPFLFTFFGSIGSADASLMYKHSERQCSPNNYCRIEDWFHYYSCNRGICDFHLQPWLYVVIAFIVLCFLLSVLATLINCICCRT